jgi:hypothetical protein
MDLESLRALGALPDNDYFAQIAQLRSQLRGQQTDSMSSKQAKVVGMELARLIEVRPRHSLLGVFLQLLRVSSDKKPVNKATLKAVFEVVSMTLQPLAEEGREDYADLLDDLAACNALGLLASRDLNDLVLKLTKTVLETASSEDSAFSLISSGLSVSSLPTLYLYLVSLTAEFKGTPRSELAKAALGKAAASVVKRVNELMLGLFTEAKGVKSAVLKTHKAEVAYQLFKLNHEFVLDLLGILSAHIKAAERDLVISAANLLGRMASCSVFASLHFHLLNEMLTLFEHRDEEVRLVMVSHSAKLSRSAVSAQVLRYATDRLRDKSEVVRRLAVIQFEKIVDWVEVPFETMQVLADRLRDKKITVRRQAVMSLTEVYSKKCLRAYVQRLPCDNTYKFIGDALISSIASISIFEDQLLVIASLETALTHFGAVGSLEALLGFYDDLQDEGKAALGMCLTGKAAWAEVLDYLLEGDEQLAGVVIGNLKESWATVKLKTSKVGDPASLVQLLQDLDVKAALRDLLGNSDFEVKRGALDALKGHASWESVLGPLVSRSCSVLLSKEQVEVLLGRLDKSSLEVLAAYGTRFHHLVLPHFAGLVSAVEFAETKAPLFTLLTALKKKMLLSEEQSGNLQFHIKQACTHGSTNDARAGALLACAVMPDAFIEAAIVRPIVEGLSLTEDFAELTRSLGVLKAVMSRKQECFEPVKQSVLAFVSKDLIIKPSPNARSQEVSEGLHAKVQGVNLLGGYALKYAGDTGELSVRNLLKRVIGLGLRLEEYLKSLEAPRVGRLLNRSETVLLRKAALASFVRLVVSKDHRMLLRGKELTYLAFISCAEEASFRDTLGKCLLQAIYESHKLHPPLTVMLALLAPSNKSYREALVFMFKSMLNLCTDQASDKQLALMPETYFHYLVYVLCRLPCRDPKFIRRSVASFVEAIAKHSKKYSSTYLNALCQQLRHFEVIDQTPVRCDLVLTFEVTSPPTLREVLDIALEYLASSYEQTEQPPTLKFLVPTSLFKSLKPLTTPSPTAARALDFSVEVSDKRKRKRTPQSGSNKRLSLGRS